MRAKDFLNQPEKLELIIKNKIIEKEQWKDAAFNITASGKSIMVDVNGKAELQNMERVQSSGNPNKMADAIGNYIDADAEIKEYKRLLKKARQDIIRMIENLPSAQYDLIHKIYIQKYTLKEVAFESKKSYSWAKRVHSGALRNIQKRLDKAEK